LVQRIEVSKLLPEELLEMLQKMDVQTSQIDLDHKWKRESGAIPLPDNHSTIEAYLAGRIGLNAGSLGREGIGRAINRIMARHTIASNDELLKHLASDGDLFDEVIAEVTVARHGFSRR
jgi:hypothetical protein